MFESFNKFDITCLNMYKCISVGPTLVQPIYTDFISELFFLYKKSLNERLRLVFENKITSFCEFTKVNL